MILKHTSFLLFLLLYISAFSLARAEGDSEWAGQCKQAQAALQQSRFADGERLLAGALLEAKKFGEQSSRVGITLGSLAGVYQAEGKFSSAEDLYEQSIKIKEKSLGADHPNLAVSYNNLAALYSKEGKLDKAIPLMSKALAIMEKHQAKDSPDLLMLRSNLAQLSSSHGDDALAELQSTLAEREKTSGSNSFNVAQSLNNLAEWYRLHGQFEKAEPLYQRSLSIAETSTGKDNPYTFTVVSNLGVLLMQEKKFALAEPLLTKALAGREKVLGIKHPDFVASLRDLAVFYRCTGRTSLAQEFDSRAEKALVP